MYYKASLHPEFGKKKLGQNCHINFLFGENSSSVCALVECCVAVTNVSFSAFLCATWTHTHKKYFSNLNFIIIK